jgi:hypothetical protein
LVDWQFWNQVKNSWSPWARENPSAGGNTTTITIPRGCALYNSGIRPQHDMHRAFEEPNEYNPDLQKRPVTFDGTVKPETVIFQFQTTWDQNSRPSFATINNFPYDPKDFNPAPVQVGFFHWQETWTGTPHTEPAIVNGLVLKNNLKLKVNILFPAKTNYNAIGQMRITPARPVFDFLGFE